MKITFNIILNVFSNAMQFVNLFFIFDLLIIFLSVQGFWIFEFASYLPIWGGIFLFILLISILRGRFLLDFFHCHKFFGMYWMGAYVKNESVVFHSISFSHDFATFDSNPTTSIWLEEVIVFLCLNFHTNLSLRHWIFCKNLFNWCALSTLYLQLAHE